LDGYRREAPFRRIIGSHWFVRRHGIYNRASVAWSKHIASRVIVDELIPVKFQRIQDEYSYGEPHSLEFLLELEYMVKFYKEMEEILCIQCPFSWGFSWRWLSEMSLRKCCWVSLSTSCCFHNLCSRCLGCIFVRNLEVHDVFHGCMQELVSRKQFQEVLVELQESQVFKRELMVQWIDMDDEVLDLECDVGVEGLVFELTSWKGFAVSLSWMENGLHLSGRECPLFSMDTFVFDTFD
jgi:hypothetical protein